MPKITIGHGTNAHRIIISLCDYSGRWPSGYIAQGYTVAQFDLKHGDDCLDIAQTALTISCIRRAAGPDAHIVGVLAAPVCTDFSVSGAQYWPAKDADGTTAKSLALVDACMAIINSFKPDWWALENPVGRLKKLRPDLPFVGWFQPHNYAAYDLIPDDSRYTKKTGIWGTARLPSLVIGNMDPIRYCKQGSWLQQLGGKSERTKELRSMTPLGFARAFAFSNT